MGSQSLYTGDVPIQRLKFNARQEYEYLENFKILQKAFKQHQIDKVSCFTLGA
jgi:hypothetical protein